MSVSNFNAAPYQVDDTTFRAWGKAISDAMTAVGFVKDSVAGQIDWAAVAHPTSTSQVMGFEIRKFTDTLVSTTPMYARLEYGSASVSAGYPQIKLTVGRAIDGSGNLTGNTTTAMLIANATSVNTSLPCYVSGDTDRISVALFTHAATGYVMGFTIGRTKDDTGANTDEGINVLKFNGGSQTTDCQSQFLPKGSGVAFPGTVMSGFCTNIPNVQTTGIYGSNLGLFPIMPYVGYAGNPILGAMAYYHADIAVGTSVSIQMYGSTRTYITTGKPSGMSINGCSGTVAIAIRND